METIIFKVPDGTKSRLRSLNPNLSTLLREQTIQLLEGKNLSAHAKARHLIVEGPGNLSTGKAYLKRYAQKADH